VAATGRTAPIAFGGSALPPRVASQSLVEAARKLKTATNAAVSGGNGDCPLGVVGIGGGGWGFGGG
jgi:hypothetical protein